MEHSKFHLDLNRCILWNFDPGIEIFVYIISIKVFLAGYFVFSLIVCRYYVALQRIHPNPSLPNLSHNNHSYSIVCKIRYPDIQISKRTILLFCEENKCWHEFLRFFQLALAFSTISKRSSFCLFNSKTYTSTLIFLKIIIFYSFKVYTINVFINFKRIKVVKIE